MLDGPIDQDEVEANLTQLSPDFAMSDDLRTLAAGLTNQQQSTLHRVAVAFLSKRKGAIGALFKGDDPVCAKAVFYRKKKARQPAGWYHQVNYRAALNRYMAEYAPHYEKRVLAEAESLLKMMALKSVQRLDELLDSTLENVQLGAVKLAMDKIGLGKSEDTERVTVVIAGAEWRPS